MDNIFSQVNEVDFELQNYIHLLIRTDSAVQYVDESIKPLNKRMNIHRKGKSGCEISIRNYKTFCKNPSFAIQIIEKLTGNGY